MMLAKFTMNTANCIHDGDEDQPCMRYTTQFEWRRLMLYDPRV